MRYFVIDLDEPKTKRDYYSIKEYEDLCRKHDIALCIVDPEGFNIKKGHKVDIDDIEVAIMYGGLKESPQFMPSHYFSIEVTDTNILNKNLKGIMVGKTDCRLYDKFGNEAWFTVSVQRK